MRGGHLLLPGLALGSALLLWSSAEPLLGFSTLGGTLDLSQRDFRVYDNFTDATANDNQTPHPSFPGASGAALAIWKASVEWGSTKHGDGNGDPHQILGLGSGGANFDPSYQGLAGAVDGTNDNVHSQISGSNGGVLAYTEIPIADGWRIRYYECWTWEDGPEASIGFGTIDIQGVACHEYGHALGLGHSTVVGSTMYATITGSGITQRSIATDDKAGVQSLYGVASSTKPRITSAAISGGLITLHGTNFPSSGGQVWFTRGTAGGDGTPVAASGTGSPDGTSITALIPADAGPGDVLVKGLGSAHSALSNAWPTDLQGDAGCLDPDNYCVTSPNSAGSGATMSWTGTTSILADDFCLISSGLPPNQFLMFYYGAGQTQTVFGNGYRCATADGVGVFRFAPFQADFNGYAMMKVDYTQPPAGTGGGLGQWVPGDEWNVQAWYRDPAGGGAEFNLSDAVHLTVCP